MVCLPGVVLLGAGDPKNIESASKSLCVIEMPLGGYEDFLPN